MVKKETLGVVGKVLDRKSDMKKSRKGFTLVELIVVLVILTILAAVAIPVMLGFIDNSRNKEYIQQAEASLKSSQAAITDVYNDGNNRIIPERRMKARMDAGVGEDTKFRVWTSQLLVDGSTPATSDNRGAYTIQYAEYISADNKYVVYNGKDWEVYDNKNKADNDKVYDKVAENEAIKMWGYPYEINMDYAYSPGKDYDEYTWRAEEEEASDMINVTIKGNDGNADLVQFTLGGKTGNELKLQYDKSNGFNVNLENLVITPNKKYKFDSLMWEYTFNEANDRLSHESKLAPIAQFLFDNFDAIIQGSKEMEFVATMEHGILPVSVSFAPYNDKTQTVSIKGLDGSNTINYNYDMVDGTLEQNQSQGQPAIDNIADSVNVASKIKDEEPGAIEPSGEWLEVTGEGSEKTYTKVGELTDSMIKGRIDTAVEAALDESGIDSVNLLFETPADVNKKMYLTALREDKEKVYFSGDPDKKVYDFEFVQNEYEQIIKSKLDDTEIKLTKDSSGKVTNANYDVVGISDYNPGTTKIKSGDKINVFKVWNISNCAYDGSEDSVDRINSEKYNNKDCRARLFDRIYGNNTEDKFGVYAEVDVDFINSMLKYNLKHKDVTVANYNGENIDQESKPIWQDLLWLVGETPHYSGDTMRKGFYPQIRSVNFISEPIEPGGEWENDVYREKSISIVELKQDPDNPDKLLVQENPETGEKDYVKEQKTAYPAIDLENYPSYIVAYSVKCTDVTSSNYNDVKNAIAEDMANNDFRTLRGIGDSSYYYPENYDMYDIYIFIEDSDIDTMKAKLSLRSWFMNFCNMESCDVMEHVETSEVLFTKEMFYGCRSLNSVNLSGIDTADALDMSWMFVDCDEIRDKNDLNLTNKFDSGQNWWFRGMFLGCDSLVNFDIPISFGQARVIDRMFQACPQLKEVTLDGTYTGEDDMGTHLGQNTSQSGNRYINEVFAGCEQLQKITLRDMHSEHITNEHLKWFFNYDNNTKLPHLKEVIFDNITFGGVTSTERLFLNCGELTTVDVRGLALPNLTSTKQMFQGCGNLGDVRTDGNGEEVETGVIGFDQFDMSSVTDMSYMFRYCTKLSGDFRINIHNAVWIGYMFDGCNITSLVLDGAEIPGTEDKDDVNTTLIQATNIVYGCNNLSAVEIYNINSSSFVSKDADENGIRWFFRTGSNGNGNNASPELKKVIIDNVKFTGVTSLKYMFYNCSKLTYVDLSGLETPNVTNTSYMFEGCSSLTGTETTDETTGDVTGMLRLSSDVSVFTQNVTDMSYMFKNCTNLTGVNKMHIDNAHTLQQTFYGCSKLESIELIGDSNIADSELGNIDGIFTGCNLLNTVKIKDLNTSKLSNSGNGQFSKFFNTTKVGLVEAEVSNVNIPNVTSFESLFEGCTNLKRINFTDLTTGNLESTKKMFYGCSSLTGTTNEESGDKFKINGFDTTKVTNMESMFQGCSSLTGIDELHIDSATNIKYLFKGCSGLVKMTFTGSSAEDGSYSISSLNKSNTSELFSGTKIRYLKIKDIEFNNSTNANNNRDSVLHGIISSAKSVKDNNKTIIEYNNTPTTDKETLEEVIFEHVNAPEIGSLWYLFGGGTDSETAAKNLVHVDLSGLDAPKNVSIKQMFRLCSRIKNDDLNWGNFITERVKYADGLFGSCYGLTSTNMNGFDTSGIQDVSWLFEACTGLESATVNISSATKINKMFVGCSRLKNVSFVGGGETKQSSISDTSNVLENCNKIESIRLEDINDTKISNFNNFRINNMKTTLKSFEVINSTFDSLNSTSELFDGFGVLERVDFTGTSTKNVTNMNKMFNNCYSLNSITFGDSFSTAKVTNMSNMFNSCYSLKTLDISMFDTGSVSQSGNINNMFGTSTGSQAESNLTTIFASEATEAAFKKYSTSNTGVFGDKLTNLVGGNETAFSSIKTSDGSWYNKSKYGLIDGKDGQIGYFTDASEKIVYLKTFPNQYWAKDTFKLFSGSGSEQVSQNQSVKEFKKVF